MSKAGKHHTRGSKNAKANTEAKRPERTRTEIIDGYTSNHYCTEYAIAYIKWLTITYNIKVDGHSRDTFLKDMLEVYDNHVDAKHPDKNHEVACRTMETWAKYNVANYGPKDEASRSFAQSNPSASSQQPGPPRSGSSSKATYAELKTWEYAKLEPFKYQNLNGDRLVRDPHGTFADGTKRPGYQKYTPKSTTNSNNDLYAILGVSRDAAQLEIRKAFRKLAMELHPDKAKEVGKVKDDNEVKFKDKVKLIEFLAMMTRGSIMMMREKCHRQILRQNSNQRGESR
ncbi:hypothetical protein FB567DRAFT_589650 [Paraphoma chrysanthemicola]|uniref:J domain-containing protein n=1 Tax=Paraphoma chrysanthemicola TaxID=798071 RepID=A0A8K0R9Q8_9PLEO|nr:hypothetical protein FB567DRAFT_589650 [Paraphoma chrysanthemicola]